MNRWAARADGNQTLIVDALRAIGCSVSILRQGSGVPDLVVGLRGRTVLLEVKGPEGSLTEDQEAWWRNWKGEAYIVQSVGEALKAMTGK